MKVEVLHENSNAKYRSTRMEIDRDVAEIKVEGGFQAELSPYIIKYLKFTLNLPIPYGAKTIIGRLSDSTIKRVEFPKSSSKSRSLDWDYDDEFLDLDDDEFAFNLSVETKWYVVQGKSQLASGSIIMHFTRVIAKFEDIRRSCHTDNLSDKNLLKCLSRMSPGDFYFNKARLDSIDVIAESVSEGLSPKKFRSEEDFEIRLTPKLGFSFEEEFRDRLEYLVFKAFSEFTGIEKYQYDIGVSLSRLTRLSRFSISDALKNKKNFQFSWSILDLISRALLASGTATCKIKRHFFRDYREGHFTIEEIYVKGRISFKNINLMKKRG